MKVTIKKVEAYEVSVDGKSLGRFDKGSDWNGMTELVSSRGKVIIADHEQPLRDVFSIFGSSDSRDREVECVMATPGLVPAKKAAPPPPEPSIDRST